MKPGQTFADLLRLAAHLRGDLENKKAILLYAYNGTGKTRLSMTFKDMGKQAEPAIPCISTPSPKTYSTGTMIW